MSDKMYSIKELADRNQVTKAAVRKLMDDEFRQNHTQPSGNRILIDEAGAAQIDEHFTNQFADTEKEVSSNESETTNGNQHEPRPGANKNRNQNANQAQTALLDAKDEMIAQLKEQLAVKDEQIAQLHKLMDQNQQLLLAEQRQSAGLIQEGSGTDQTAKNTESEQKAKKFEAPNNEETQKKSWWSKIFNWNRCQNIIDLLYLFRTKENK